MSGWASQRGPYKAVEKSGYWLCTDTRTGASVSYPTTQSQARREAKVMNDAWREAQS